MAIVTSLVVAAAVVMITYLYASGATPPSINTIIAWIVVTFQRGLNVLSNILGQQPLFLAVQQMGATAAPVAAGAAGAVQAGARDIEDVLSSAERAVADTVTPGGGGSAMPTTASAGTLGASVDSGLGYCYVGQAQHGRVCAPVSRHSGCMSGEYYTSREQCRLNTGPRLGTQRPAGGSWENAVGSLL